MPKKKPILEKIFKVTNNVTKKSINAISNIVGFYCEIYYPKGQLNTLDGVKRVFGNDTQKFIYSEVPNKKDNLIVIGLFGDQFKASDASFDNMNGDEPYILTHKDKKIPKNTKIKIYRGKNYHLMKVQSYKVYPSVLEGQIYYKNMIVPYN